MSVTHERHAFDTQRRVGPDKREDLGSARELTSKSTQFSMVRAPVRPKPWKLQRIRAYNKSNRSSRALGFCLLTFVMLNIFKGKAGRLHSDMHDSGLLHQELEPGAPRGQSSVSLVVSCFKRVPNIQKIILEASAYRFFTEFIVVNNDRKRLSPDEFSLPHTVTKRLRVINSKRNMFTWAKYVGCAVALSELCFIIDDDFLPNNLISLHMIAMRRMDRVVVATDEDSWFLTEKWTCIDNVSSLHAGFTWLGTGAFVSRNMVLEFQRVQKALHFDDEQRRFSDLYFSLLQNERPIVVQKALNQSGLLTGNAFSCRNCHAHRSKNAQHQMRALRLLKDGLHQVMPQRFIKRRVSKWREQALCANDSCVFISTLNPLEDKIDSNCNRKDPFSKGYPRGVQRHGIAFRHAVDGDPGTFFVTKPMTSADWYGIVLVEESFVAEVKLTWGGCPSPLEKPHLEITSDLSSWQSTGSVPSETPYGHIYHFYGPGLKLQALRFRCHKEGWRPLNISEISYTLSTAPAPPLLFIMQHCHTRHVLTTFLEQVKHDIDQVVAICLISQSEETLGSLRRKGVHVISADTINQILQRGTTSGPPDPVALRSIGLVEWLKANNQFRVVHYDFTAVEVIHALQMKSQGLAFQMVQFVAHVHSVPIFATHMQLSFLGNYEQLLRSTLEVQVLTLADSIVYGTTYLFEETERCVFNAGRYNGSIFLLEQSLTVTNPRELSHSKTVHWISHGPYSRRSVVELRAIASLTNSPLVACIGGGERFVAGFRKLVGSNSTLTVQPIEECVEVSARLFLPTSYDEISEFVASYEVGLTVFAPSWYIGVFHAFTDYDRLHIYFPGKSYNSLISCMATGCPWRSNTTVPAILKMQHTSRSVHSQIMSTYSGTVRTRYSNVERFGPLVSICIPTFNRGSQLLEAVTSVLNSTYSNLEVIVVDDGSERQFESFLEIVELILEERQIGHLHRLQHVGGCHARNFAARKAAGDLVFFFDSDDVLFPDSIEKMVSVMDITKADVVTGWVQKVQIERNEKLLSGIYGPIGPFYPLTLFSNTFGAGAALHKKSAFFDVGGYEEVSIGVAFQDYNLYMKLQEAGKKIVMIPEAIYGYTVNSANSVFHGSVDVMGNRQHAVAPAFKHLDPYSRLLLSYTIGRTDLSIAGNNL